MSRRVRLRVEVVLAAVSTVLTVLSLAWPTWFEDWLGESPDGGDGSAERLLALVWLAGTVLFTLLARRDARLLRARPSP
ncbi:hypothetical protein [Angustibacter aerolatus]|uniref:Uncharacterized protein n=1 Tax=Angustibacter aerolatus TaxID=1162965 RepID=A0ABQ6JPB8_9ACTN|nr:hypothetical protein [Angustibacter aerolatus]GMA88969.1 hypothetical protein GCM10025868_42190 [Angustibacter aerolatus]